MNLIVGIWHTMSDREWLELEGVVHDFSANV
jgi:hypothetical protein